MVAKSYQNLEIVSDVYTVNAKTYVKVRTTSGVVRQVRWYSEKEYAKYYGAAASKSTTMKEFKTQKEVLGFGAGFITIFKGDTYAAKETLKEAGATYTRLWGWGIAGDKEVPEIAGLTPIRLDWDKVKSATDPNSLASDEAVTAYVDTLVCDPSPSTYQGEIGERITILVRVEKNVQISGFYGDSTVHTFVDEDGNQYVWITASKSLAEGKVMWLAGTVKDHKLYKNAQQTVLTRCRVIEEIESGEEEE